MWTKSANFAPIPPLRLAKSRPAGGCSLAWRLRAHTPSLRSVTPLQGEASFVLPEVFYTPTSPKGIGKTPHINERRFP